MEQENLHKQLKEILIKRLDVEEEFWNWQEVLEISDERVRELDTQVQIAFAKVIAKQASICKTIAECLKQSESVEELVYMLLCWERALHMHYWAMSKFADVVYELNEFEKNLAWSVEAMKRLITSLKRG